MSYASLKWNKPNIHFFGTIKILPGMNFVDKAQHDLITSHPLTKHYIASDLLEIELLPEDQHGISGFNNALAIKLVKETFNIELLNSWSESESRKSVKRAIESQIELLKLQPEDLEPVVPAPKETEEHFS